MKITGDRPRDKGLISVTLKILIGVISVSACAYDIYIFKHDIALFSMDGAFQTYNAVHSFGKLERVGVDFQSYLGVLMPISLLPLYFILGQSLFASTAASVAAVYIFIFLSVLALCHYSRIPKPYTFIVSIVVFAILGIVPRIHQEILLPGLSLRPLRWSLPYILSFMIYPLFYRITSKSADTTVLLTTAFLTGVVGGLALLWSNDLGMPTLIALLGCFSLLTLVKNGYLVAVQALIISGMVSMLTAFLLIIVLSGNNFGSWFSYNYIDIVSDQYWLFAPWDEPKRIFSPLEIWKIFVNGHGAAAVILVPLIIVCLKLVRDIIVHRGGCATEVTQLFMYSAAIGGALLPQVGGHIALRYLPGAALALPFALTALLPGRDHRLANLLRHRFASVSNRWIGFAPALAVSAVLLMHVVMIWRVHDTVGSHAVTVYHPVASASELNSGPAVFIPQLDVWTRDKQAGAVQIFAASRPMFAFWPPRRRVFSDYYSAINIVTGADQSSSLPTIIHALGERQRAKFRADLLTNRPPIATTLRTRQSQPWEAWNFRTSWPFYRTLIDTYEPFAASSHHIFWRRRIHELAAPVPINCQFRGTGDGKSQISLFTTDPSLGSKAWLTDVRTDFGQSISKLRYRSVEETAGPSLDPVRKPERLEELKGYGLSPARYQHLLMEVRPNNASVVQVRSLPSRNRYGKPIGHCRATAIMPDPFHHDWPIITKSMLDRVLKEEMRREVLFRQTG
ncbi:MAG TPA: hypothetical protein VF637_02885 [Sphingomicrobium sp.]|jgi:hypothetical protein